MENNQQQIKFNDLTRDFLEEFIAKLPKEDKIKLKEYIQDHPCNSSSALFTMVKSYIYNYYFRANSLQNKQKKDTFANVLDSLLVYDDNE